MCGEVVEELVILCFEVFNIGIDDVNCFIFEEDGRLIDFDIEVILWRLFLEEIFVEWVGRVVVEDFWGFVVWEGLCDLVIVLDLIEGWFVFVFILGFKLFVLGCVVFVEDFKVFVFMEVLWGIFFFMIGGIEIIGGLSLCLFFLFVVLLLLLVVFCDWRVVVVDEEDFRKGFGDDGVWFCSVVDMFCFKEFRVVFVSLVLLLFFIGVCVGVEVFLEFFEGVWFKLE